jgi:hypothetical protein
MLERPFDGERNFNIRGKVEKSTKPKNLILNSEIRFIANQLFPTE